MNSRRRMRPLPEREVRAPGPDYSIWDSGVPRRLSGAEARKLLTRRRRHRRQEVRELFLPKDSHAGCAVPSSLGARRDDVSTAVLHGFESVLHDSELRWIALI